MGGEWSEKVRAVESFDEAVSVGVEILGAGSEANWALGELGAAVLYRDSKTEGGFVPRGELDEKSEEMDDELDAPARTLRTFAASVRVGYSRLKEAVRVYRAVEPGVRASFAGLYWSHWRVLVRDGRAGDDLIGWARAADDGGWSADRLEAELRENNGGQESDNARGQALEKALGGVGFRLRRALEDERTLAFVISTSPETVRGLVLTAKRFVERAEELWAELRDAGDRIAVANAPGRTPLGTNERLYGEEAENGAL